MVVLPSAVPAVVADILQDGFPSLTLLSICLYQNLVPSPYTSLLLMPP